MGLAHGVGIGRAEKDSPLQHRGLAVQDREAVQNEPTKETEICAHWNC